MLRFYILAIVFLIFFSSRSHCQDFYSFTSKLFFNVGLTNSNDIILSDFAAKAELKTKNDTGWTAYPFAPIDENGDFIPFYTYAFSSHPVFLTNIINGELLVMTKKNTNKVIAMIISITFKETTNIDVIYGEIKKSYLKYSSKEIKRPNISKPFEVTKYIAKNGNDYVIITKAIDMGKPYLHIEYNYQDYKW